MATMWRYTPATLRAAFASGRFEINPNSSQNEGLFGCYPLAVAGGEFHQDFTERNNHGLGTAGIIELPSHHPAFGGINALDFTGNDSIEITSPELLALPATLDFTVSFWYWADLAAAGDAAFAWSGTDDLVIYPNDTNSGFGDSRVFWRDLGGSLLNINGADLSGSWQHLTFVCRSLTDMETYRNGLSTATDSGTGAVGSLSNVYIGAFGPGSQEFNGRMKDVRIYDHALRVDEVEQLVNNPLGLYRPIKKRTFINYVPVPSTGTGGRLRAWTISPERRMAAYRSGQFVREDCEQSNDLLGWWPLNNAGNESFDYSGYNSHAVHTNVTQELDVSQHPRWGAIDSSRWNGTTDIMTATAPPQMGSIWAGGGLASFWMKNTSQGETSKQWWLAKGVGTTGWGLQNLTTNKFRFFVAWTGGAFSWDGTNNDWVTGQWHHIAIEYNSNSTANDPTIYVDGMPVVWTVNPTPTGTYVDDASTNFLLGNHPSAIRTLDGIMSDVRIFGDNNSTGQIHSLYVEPWRSARPISARRTVFVPTPVAGGFVDNTTPILSHVMGAM